jgi:hypothetical protein
MPLTASHLAKCLKFPVRLVKFLGCWNNFWWVFFTMFVCLMVRQNHGQDSQHDGTYILHRNGMFKTKFSVITELFPYKLRE